MSEHSLDDKIEGGSSEAVTLVAWLKWSNHTHSFRENGTGLASVAAGPALLNPLAWSEDDEPSMASTLAYASFVNLV